METAPSSHSLEPFQNSWFSHYEGDYWERMIQQVFNNIIPTSSSMSFHFCFFCCIIYPPITLFSRIMLIYKSNKH
jgi:hypothetical protein